MANAARGADSVRVKGRAFWRRLEAFIEAMEMTEVQHLEVRVSTMAEELARLRAEVDALRKEAAARAGVAGLRALAVFH